MKIKSYILSLKNSERRIQFDINNKNKGIEYVFFDAVEGVNFDNKYIDEINRRLKNRYGRIIGRNEIACADSHIEIYKDMILNKIEWAFIFEDDIKFKDEFIMMSNLDLPCNDIYILGGQDGLPSFDMVVFDKNISLYCQNMEFKKVIKSEKYIYRTCGYLINVNLAKKIVEQRDTSFFLADDWDYLYKNNVFDSLYYCNKVEHPLDINLSSIEVERKGKDTVISYLKKSFLRKIKKNLRHSILRFKCFQ